MATVTATSHLVVRLRAVLLAMNQPRTRKRRKRRRRRSGLASMSRLHHQLLLPHLLHRRPLMSTALRASKPMMARSSRLRLPRPCLVTLGSAGTPTLRRSTRVFVCSPKDASSAARARTSSHCQTTPRHRSTLPGATKFAHNCANASPRRLRLSSGGGKKSMNHLPLWSP